MSMTPEDVLDNVRKADAVAHDGRQHVINEATEMAMTILAAGTTATLDGLMKRPDFTK